MFMFLFLFFSMLLLCSFFRLTELFQVKSGVTTSLLLFFFLENAKNLGRSDCGKRRKKRGWPKLESIKEETDGRTMQSWTEEIKCNDTN